MSIKPRDLVKSHPESDLKMYIEYDGSSRMVKTYECSVATAHGGKCLVTEYAYVGASDRIQKMKEYEGVWDASWEI